MILHRAQIEFDTELQLVGEMIDALAGSGLSWLSDQEHMDVEPGLNDFDPTELEWLVSLTRNAKSVLATTIAKRFTEAKAWESQGYPRQLQIVIRILSVVQEFRRLNDVLVVAITNNTRQDILATLINAVATCHPPLEGMGFLPNIIDAIAANVSPPHSSPLTIVAQNLPRSQTKHPPYLPPNPAPHPPRLLQPPPRPTHRRIHLHTTIPPPRIPHRRLRLPTLRPRSRKSRDPRHFLCRRSLSCPHSQWPFRCPAVSTRPHCHDKGMYI
jgi:hypothetical protein